MKTWTTTPTAERQIAIACNSCGADRPRPFLADVGYRFVRCAQCGLVYQNPQPVFDDLRKRYSDDYFDYEINNETNFFNLMKLGLRDIDFATLSTPFAAEERTFLDIGCATGMLLAHMRAGGWSVRGVDLTPQSAAYGREQRGLDIFAGTLEEAGFADGSFAVVHFSHLIEHVPDPAAFLAEVARVVVPGGLVLVTTPNVRGLQARLFGNAWRSAIADHVFLFSKPTLRRALHRAGLQVERTVTWGGLAVGTAPPVLKRPADWLAKRLGFGDVMMMVARKLVAR